MKKYRIATGLTLMLIVLCLLMLARVHPRLVVSIDGFHQHTNRITIGGGNSGVCFDKIPEQYMEVKYEEGGFLWEVNPKYLTADSLCYYKVNGQNPNLHLIDEGDSIVVQLEGKEKRIFSLSEIESALKGVRSQYVLLCHVLEKIDREAGKKYTLKSLSTVKSFLWRSQHHYLLGSSLGDWQLVILDRKTRLIKEGREVAYVDHGNTLDLTPDHANSFKIQFFRMADYSYQTAKADRQSLCIDGVNYQAKAVLVPTTWTAGHALIQPNSKEGLDVHFPKAITYVEDLDTLRSFVNTSSNMLTMMQMDGSFPVSRNLYVPHFSGAISQYICNLYLDKDSVSLRNGDTTLKVKTGWNVMPTFRQISMKSAQHEEIFIRTGIINYLFILSYLWLPLIIFLLIYIVYPWLTDTSRIIQRRGLNVSRGDLIPHFRTLALLALGYCVCKVMIAFKLSYSYPYFEKLTGIISVSTGLMLMLFFTVSLILNRDFLTASLRNHQRPHREWKALAVSGMGVLLCYLSMKWMDAGFNASMLKAYLPEDLFSMNLFRWQELSGMNDLHRSVPYSLFFANLLAMAVLLVLTLPAVQKWNNPFDGGLQQYYNKVDKGFATRPQTSLVKVLVFLLKYALVPLIVVFLVSLLPGNFSTAFITLSVIIGMSWTLSHISFANGRIIAFVEMLLVVLLFVMAAAVKADMGYMTNFFGMFFAIILFYFMQERGGYDHEHQKASKKEQKWIPRLMIASVILVLAMPVLLSKLLDTENVAYSRAARRFNMYSQFEKYRNSGYRYAVSDTEFMTVMVHYMFNANGADPLSNEHHYLHPSISSGQSPVVLNDVSLQSAFFGSYGWLAYVVYFGLLVLLAWLVLAYSFRDPGGVLHPQLRWRLLAVLMWVGTTLYLYISYVGQLPFTGRLNPGFGVDSVGEMLETALLLAFMTATALDFKEKRQNITK